MSAHMSRAERAQLMGDTRTCRSCGEALEALQVPLTQHPDCARRAVRKIDIDALSAREALIYSAAYSEALADLAPDLDELKRTCSTLTRQLVLAVADADYYRKCSTLKPGIVRRVERGITIDHNRRAWRQDYGMDGAAA